MTVKVTVLQKDKTRYTFRQETENGKSHYCIQTEQLLTTGAGCSFRWVNKAEGNRFYKERINDGFHRFRSVCEVSWYATDENNTPYPEVWKVENNFFIPVDSHVIRDN